MKAKTIRRSAVALMAGGSMAAAASYTWIGSNNDNWDDPNAWGCTFCGASGYPSTAADDATMEENHTVMLPGSETIDDLYLANGGSLGGPTLDADETPATITADAITIVGANSATTVVTVVDGAGLKTN